jgi:hypothetical protein
MHQSVSWKILGSRWVSNVALFTTIVGPYEQRADCDVPPHVAGPHREGARSV